MLTLIALNAVCHDKVSNVRLVAGLAMAQVEGHFVIYSPVLLLPDDLATTSTPGSDAAFKHLGAQGSNLLHKKDRACQIGDLGFQGTDYGQLYLVTCKQHMFVETLPVLLVISLVLSIVASIVK